MKNFNADTTIVRLRTKQKALNIELNQLKREVTAQFGTERKKRYLLKQIESTEKNIEEINQLIKQEKKIAVKQYTQKSEEMFRTPPKRLNTTFEETTEKDQQPTMENLNQDIIERNVSPSIQTQTSSILPSVTFTIPISNDETITTKSSITQIDKNQLDPVRTITLDNLNEKSTGALPKIRRSNKALDFSQINPNSQTIYDPFELPKNRNTSDTLNLPTASNLPKGLSGILTNMNAHRKQSTEELNTRKELDKFFNTLPPVGQQKSNARDYHSEFDTLATDLASNFSTNNNIQNKPTIQNQQIPISMGTPHPMQQNENRNSNANISIHSPINKIPQNLQSQMNSSLNLNPNQPQYKKFTATITDTEFPYEESHLEVNTNPNQSVNLLAVNQPVQQPQNQQSQNIQGYVPPGHLVNVRTSFLKTLDKIPTFRGESHTELREFIDTADILFVTIQNRSEKDEFYHQLLLQIRGEARNAISNLDELN